MFQLSDLEREQRYVLQDKVKIPKKEHGFLPTNLGEFLCFLLSYQKLKYSTAQTQNWYWIYNIERQSLSQLLQRYHWKFKQTNSLTVPLWQQQILHLLRRKVWQHGNQFKPTENVNLNHTQIYQIDNNRKHVASQNGIIESTYDGHIRSWLLLRQQHYGAYWEQVLSE